MNNFVRHVGAALLFTAMLQAAGLTGIWMGEVPGKNGEKQDLAFQFKESKGVITGVMFGDEFDLPVQDLHIEGDHVTFTVTSINYYDGRRVTTAFSGTVTGGTLELTREASGPKETKQVSTLRKTG